MPDPGIAQFTSVFRVSATHRVKRCRQTVSCAACQRRKSRCDRQHPCGACEKRGCGESCSYGANASSSSSAVSGREKDRDGLGGGGGGGSRRDVQMKLNQLEQMVQALAEKRTSSGNGNSNGQGKDETETSYHGATSWTALVEGIRDIQDMLADAGDAGEGAYPGPEPEPEPELLLGAVPPITLNDVVDSLPPRQDADRLILAYFKAKFVAAIFIHTHQFKRRYDAFWADPSSAGFLWISILFSILSIGTMVANTRESSSSNASSSSSSSSSSSAPDSRFYMTKSAQCLLAGRYLDGTKRLSVEALLMHAHSRNVQKLDSDSSLWSLYGLAARLAQKQGYHRGTRTTTMTPFEAEMRRRTWFLIQSTDLLFSFQNGMPPIIADDSCDVRHPTNLLDDDFDEDCAALPPPRPPTDPHPILAYIVKSHLCAVMRRVVRHVLAASPTSSHAETLALNGQLDEWRASVPACLRIRTIRDTAFTDPNHTIMHRLMLELMYLKSLCILHRPYLTSHKHDPTYNASRQICRESALKILGIQVELDVETAPGGRMYEDRFMVSNLTLHHFLLAAMIICLDLSESTDIDSKDRRKRITTLRTAYTIWSARSTTSADALHASRVLRAILNRIDSYSSAAPSSSSTGSAGPVTQTPIIASSAQDLASCASNDYGNASSDSAAMQHVVLPVSNTSHNMHDWTADETLPGQQQQEDMSSAMPNFEDMFDNIDMLDWSSLDQYIQSDSGPWRQNLSDN